MGQQLHLVRRCARRCAKRHTALPGRGLDVWLGALPSDRAVSCRRWWGSLSRTGIRVRRHGGGGQ